MGFTEIVTIIFIIAKLTHYIDWSWFYIFLPVIIFYPIAFIVFIVCIVMGVSFDD